MTNDVKALIVENEPTGRTSLYNMLTHDCSGIEVVAQTTNVSEAVKAIHLYKPHLVFLGIELPVENGFKLFDYFDQPNFDVIFITANDQYAVQAFKFSAVDYLIKPINPDDLRKAIQKVATKGQYSQNLLHYQILKENLNKVLQKIALPTADGILFRELSEIIRCEAQGNYTFFYLVNGERIMVSKTLKIYDELLEDFNFFRINRTDLINLSKVRKYGRQKSPFVTLVDGTSLLLSDNRRKDFLERV